VRASLPIAVALLSTLLFVRVTQGVPADADARARALMADGARLYEQADYAGALERFVAAHRETGNPKLLFNVAQALRALARDPEAIATFERFLAEAGDTAPEARREAADAIAVLRGQAGAVEVVAEVAGARIVIDGQPRGETPARAPILLSPGFHQVVVEREGSAPFLASIEARAGVTERLHVALRPRPLTVRAVLPPSAGNLTAAPPALGQGSEASPSSRWPWIALGGVVIAAGVVLVALLARGPSTPTSDGATHGSYRPFAGQ
jgi:hypothetical protein